MPVNPEEQNEEKEEELQDEVMVNVEIGNLETNYEEQQRDRRPTVRDSVAIGLYDKDRRKSMRRRVEEIKWNGMDYYQAKDCITVWKVYLIFNCFIYWICTIGFGALVSNLIKYFLKKKFISRLEELLTCSL